VHAPGRFIIERKDHGESDQNSAENRAIQGNPRKRAQELVPQRRGSDRSWFWLISLRLRIPPILPTPIVYDNSSDSSALFAIDFTGIDDSESF